MTGEDALLRLADASAESVEGVLTMYAPEMIERGKATVLSDGTSPLEDVVLPAVATSVSYVHGVRGGNLFLVTSAGARRLAATMMGEEWPDGGGELTELESSAVGEAMNQMMAAAAGATSRMLGQEVEISTPQTHFFTTRVAAERALEATAFAVTTPFILCGEPARLIQLAPNAFVVRLARALTDLDSEVAPTTVDPSQAVPPTAMRSVPVRVSAELGSFSMAVGRAVSLVPGAVVELDQPLDEPITLFVNGRAFASGSLLVTDDGDWGVRVEALAAPLVSPGSKGGS